MIDDSYQPPEHIKLGKAKAMEAIILHDGTRLNQKTKVRYWLERTGAREDFYIRVNEKTYRLGGLEFKRRFKIIIKGGEIKHSPPVEEAE